VLSPPSSRRICFPNNFDFSEVYETRLSLGRVQLLVKLFLFVLDLIVHLSSFRFSIFQDAYFHTVLLNLAFFMKLKINLYLSFFMRRMQYFSSYCVKQTINDNNDK